jgi:hypothetical protein
MTQRYKYPRTLHLPWSEKRGDDDKVLNDVSMFENKSVVVTAKMDGENTTLYNDGTHARSIDSSNHPSRDWVKGLQGRIGYQIPEGMRICGENLYARHTVAYENLRDYFMVFSIWEGDKCLSWKETVEWCELLDLQTVPVIWEGTWDEKAIRELSKIENVENDPWEGYVVRLATEFERSEFSESVAKFVKSSFVIPDEHWMFSKIVPNGTRLSKPTTCEFCGEVGRHAIGCENGNHYD